MFYFACHSWIRFTLEFLCNSQYYSYCTLLIKLMTSLVFRLQTSWTVSIVCLLASCKIFKKEYPTKCLLLSHKFLTEYKTLNSAHFSSDFWKNNKTRVTKQFIVTPWIRFQSVHSESARRRPHAKFRNWMPRICEVQCRLLFRAFFVKKHGPVFSESSFHSTVCDSCVEFTYLFSYLLEKKVLYSRAWGLCPSV